MKASVIVNIHQGTDYSQFQSAVESILDQTYDNIELIIVSSDAPALDNRVLEDYGHLELVEHVSLASDEGLSPARNAGAEAASGEIVVFTDDDIIAHEDWISELVKLYRQHDPAGVGGHVIPRWPDEKPWYLPPEFFWLVGVMHENFVTEEEAQPVRNTFGCNISFKRSAFFEAGKFREDLGKNQKNPLQGEEAEFCERLSGEFWYTPHGIVHHRVDRDQLSVGYLLWRSFWQGYSKAALSDNMSDESSFLRDLLFKSTPKRLKRPAPANLGELGMVYLLTGAVGLGFVYGRIR